MLVVVVVAVLLLKDKLTRITLIAKKRRSSWCLDKQSVSLKMSEEDKVATSSEYSDKTLNCKVSYCY